MFLDLDWGEVVVGIRKLARHLVLDGLGVLQSAVSTPDRSGLGTVILIHQTPEPTIHRLGWLIEYLRSMGEIVSYSEANSRIREGGNSSPFFAITFDDGFKNNFSAAEFLSGMNVSACFFVCPGIINSPESKRMFYCREKLFCDPQAFLDWNDLEKLKLLGHEIGSHTVSHARLSNCSPAELEEEIGQSKESLISNLGAADHFAWPYGRFSDFSSDAAFVAFRNGYESCASGVRGSHLVVGPSRQVQFCLRRESLDLFWPKNHIRYFIQASARSAVQFDATWANNNVLEAWK